MRKKDYDQAEAAFKKALEINPTRRGVQRPRERLQRAEEVRPGGRSRRAGAEARWRCRRWRRRGGSASATFNQGVIAWNAGKIPEAQKLFEQAVAADPKMAEAHYWLGMANVNQGKLPEAVKSFEEYLKLDAAGQYAEQAKGMLAAIKK